MGCSDRRRRHARKKPAGACRFPATSAGRPVLQGSAAPRSCLAQLTSAVEQGRVVSSLPAGTRVQIHQLGSFATTAQRHSNDIHDILRGIPDLIDKANRRPDSVARCRVAYAAFMADPSEPLREALRAAYEAVPPHNRMYVGDMDTKDVAARMILYGDQEIETWSHRRVARSEGMEPLPTITVPKPRKR